MRNAEVQNLINKTICNFEGLRCYINNEEELIVSPKLNAYFRLEDVETELDFKCKCLEWLTFDVADNHWFRYDKERKKLERLINYILNTNFTHNDYQHIYCRLGNRVNHTLTIKFIESNYDMNLIKEDNFCRECPKFQTTCEVISNDYIKRR